MKDRFKVWPVLSLLFLSVLRGEDGLTWESQEIRARVAPMESGITVAWTFVNEGNETVRVIDIRSTCGCTEAAIEMDVIEPGERAQVHAYFDFEGRTGAQEQVVLVTTDRGKQVPTELLIKVEIPEAYSISRQFLHWRHGEDLKSQVINLTQAEGVEMELKEIKFDSDFLEVSFDQIETRGGGGIWVKPLSKMTEYKGIVNVHLSLNGRNRIIPIHVAID